jgi:hypothetical protein
MTIASAFGLAFLALAIVGAYAWYKAMLSFDGSREHLSKLFSRMPGRRSKRGL